MAADLEQRADDAADEAVVDALDRPRSKSELVPAEEPKRSEAAQQDDGSLLSRFVLDLRAGDSPGQTLLAVFIAWSTTVAPAALSRSASRPAALVAVLALIAGLSGPVFRSTRPTLARHLGITLFFVLTTGAWLLGSPALQPARLDPLRAAIGAVAWGAFVLSWRERWDTRPSQAATPRDPDAPVLLARSTLPRGAIFVAAIGVIAGLVYLGLAWQVRDGDRALAAQAVGVACSIGLSTVAASVAVERGRRSSSRSSRRLTPVAARSLLYLLVFVVAGVAVLVLRS